MKFFSFSALIALQLAMLLTVTWSPVNSSFSVEIDGVDKNIFKTGVAPGELGKMTIYSNNEKVAVEEFSVIVAVGDRPVSNRTVKGNSFDLSVFSEQLHAGDRILIQILQTSAGKVEKVISRVNFFIIPIK